MRNIVKILGTLATLLILGLIYFFVFKFDGCGKHKIKIAKEKAEKLNTNQIKEIQKQLLDTTSHYVQVIHNDDGSETKIKHATNSIIEGNENQINVFLKKKLDSISKELGLRNNQISSLQSELLKASGEIKSSVQDLGDQVYEIKFRDCFLSGYNIIDIKDLNQEMYYNANLKIHAVSYIHHKHHFMFLRWGKISETIDAWTDCENVYIDSIQDIKIIEK